MPTTKFLLSPGQSEGLEARGRAAANSKRILRRSTLIADDTRSEARAVLRNNFRIMNLITECIETAEESARILDSLGPARPGSRRRIGAGPPKA